MAKNIQCSIVITEVDGKLHIIGKIPDGSEGSIARALAEGLLSQSEKVMNEILGANEKIEKLAEH